MKEDIKRLLEIIFDIVTDGDMPDEDELIEIAERYGFVINEDCCVEENA